MIFQRISLNGSGPRRGESVLMNIIKMENTHRANKIWLNSIRQYVYIIYRNACTQYLPLNINNSIIIFHNYLDSERTAFKILSE